MTNIARTIPHLTKVITDIEEHAESRIKYEDTPYVIEVILPCVCSYLSYWWSIGSQKAKQPTEYKTIHFWLYFSFLIRPKVTNVTANHMNSVLGSVLKLINNNIDATEAPWMKRIAGKIWFTYDKWTYWFCEVYTQTIISNSLPSLLERYFLPVSQRLKLKCEDLYAQEQSLKHATRLESSEREDLESNLIKVKRILWINFVWCFD
jgi:ryanodine receptor 2